MASTTSTLSSDYIDADGKTDAEKYFEQIKDGTIIACRHMRRLADILLPRFNEEYHGFVYDRKKAIRPVAWIERYCCFPEGEKMGQPFILEQYERAAIEIAFGFVNKDGYRQYKQIVMMLGRKNGKTSLLAAIMLYMLTSDNPVELGAEIYCCATSESQSRKCFGAADAMRVHSPSLEKRLRRGKVQKRGVSGLNYDKTGSFLVPLAANLGKLDGLSASAVVYDELAAATDNGALLDLLEESTSARRQPLTWIISTENYVRENIWDERMEYAKGWLSGEIHDDTFLPILYTLDSKSEIYEESCWPKANPGLLCGVKSWQYLRDRVNRAKQSPRSMPSLLIKEFNLRANSASSFLTREECHNSETFTFNPETDRYGIVGFDLAKSGDLNAAVCMFMRPGDDRIYEIPHFWIAEEQIRINGAKDFKERDGVPYSLWAQSPDNFLTICEGDKVNQKVIIDWIQELANRGIYTRYVGYDSWHVDDWTQRMLADMVGKDNFEEVPQTAKVLSPAMVEHQVDLRAKRIINPCPTTEWCRSNVQSKPQDANGNWFPQKKDLKSNRRIDGYLAELFAYIELKKHWDDYLQLIGWDKT